MNLVYRQEYRIGHGTHIRRSQARVLESMFLMIVDYDTPATRT